VAFPIGRNYEDVATTYKLANKTSKILFIKNVAYYYRDRPGSITNSYTKIDVEDLLLSINEFKSNKLLVFSAKLKTNFTHRYLVGAYYMNMQLEDDLNKNLKKQLRSEILENNFLLLNLKFKFEYILFLFNIYEFYIGTKSFVKNYKGKP
jgi:hypothetical protein